MSQALNPKRSDNTSEQLKQPISNKECRISNVEVMATEDTETTEQPRITKTRNKEMQKEASFSRFVLSGDRLFFFFLGVLRVLGGHSLRHSKFLVRYS